MTKREILWVIWLSLLWPLVQIGIFLARFGNLPASALTESLYFMPVGLVSGAGLMALLRRAPNRTTRVSTVIGYLVAAPFALIGSLLSGLTFPPLIGTTLYGATPLLIGSAAGYGLGKLTTKEGKE